MTRERLQSLPLDELRRFAERQSIEFDSTIDKDSLVSLLVDLFEEMAEEREGETDRVVSVEAKKFATSGDEEIETGESEASPLPEGYNETRLVAIPRDPAWAFAYWEIRQDRLAQLKRDKDVRLLLRVHDVEGVRFNGRNSRSSFDIPVKLTDSRWYINLPRAGGSFVLELLYKKRGKEHSLVRSGVIETPSEGFSQKVDPAWSLSDGEAVLAMSLHRSVGEIPSSGSIPQRILSVG
jgi:hypothetical protein